MKGKLFFFRSVTGHSIQHSRSNPRRVRTRVRRNRLVDVIGHRYRASRKGNQASMHWLFESLERRVMLAGVK
jgi:hypothetical protein